MTAALTRADALHLPLADDSVDLVVTSPPYYLLRSYRDEGEHYAHQLGSEPSPQEFLEALWVATAECARVLKPSGSMFFNLGDKYSGAGGPGGDYNEGGLKAGQPRMDAQSYWSRSAPATSGIPAKSLMLLPERYRIGCVDRLGLIARAVVVWSKPNGLPESVTDRVRRSHEDWVHLTKAPRYFAALDEVRENYSERVQDRQGYADRDIEPGTWNQRAGRHDGNGERGILGFGHRGANPLGKLPGSVWSIPSEPLRVPDHLPQHFAAFPTEWPRRLILGWSPSGVCVECGEGRRPVVETTYREDHRQSRSRGFMDLGEAAPVGSHGVGSNLSVGSTEATIVGYACACTPYTDRAAVQLDRGKVPPNRGEHDRVVGGRSAGRAADGWVPNTPAQPPRREHHLDGWTPPPARPAVVLDPFAGTGTTVMVARALGRFGVGVDLSADYLRLARWRIWESGDAAKAVRRTNLERQGGLFTQPDAYRPTDVVETGGLL